jgi:UDP-2,3-diacylglucosamine hydrolase
VLKLFISDLHLDTSRPAATSAFLNFLEKDAPSAAALYILGDLFEVWIGDDDPDPHHRKVAEGLARLSETGTRCFFIPGNRDFLIGHKFLTASRLTLLNDPTLIYSGDESVLISHGDILCTDDISYQRFRKITRTPFVIKLFRALPFRARAWLAARARQKSIASYGSKTPEILDVNQNAVTKLMQEYNITTLLHGHTHRQAVHEFDLHGCPAKRIVLGDWYETGSILRWDSEGPRLTSLDLHN